MDDRNKSYGSGVSDWQQQSKWFDERREKIARGEVPDKTPEQARISTERPKRPVEPERIPIKKKRPKPPEKKPGIIKQFTTKLKAENAELQVEDEDFNLDPPARSAGARLPSGENGSDLSPDERRRLHTIAMKKKKKKRMTIGAIISAFAALAVFVALSLTVLFGIEVIEVEGKTRYSKEEILAASKLQKGENLWTVKSSDVSKNVGEALAYIGSVKLSRKLPATLVLNVKETTEKYALRYSKNYILLDPEGKVLSRIAKKVPKKVIEIEDFSFAFANVGKTIVSKKDAETSLETVNTLLKAAEDSGIKNVTSVGVKDGNTLYIIYANRLKIYVGNLTKLDKKLRLGKGVLDQLDSESKAYTGVINISITGKAYFKPGSVDAEVTSARSYEVKKKLGGTSPSAGSSESQTAAPASSSPAA